jgi:tocopherol O-methyltransferase
LPRDTTVLDVGCGIGGTTRHLAVEHGCTVTGITISGRQVQIAGRLTSEQRIKESSALAESKVAASKDGFIALGSAKGVVKFVEMDAETMSSHFEPSTFDGVWISEALSHFPNKPLFFQNAARVLHSGGRLIVADWFKHTSLETPQMQADIKQIEDGMLLPPLCTMAEYVFMAEQAGLRVFAKPKDISKQVAKTWDISWQLVCNPSLWAFAISQGRDGLSFLQSFRAMKRGYAEGSFRYGVMVLEKP